jgi:hypothetical protein
MQKVLLVRQTISSKLGSDYFLLVLTVLSTGGSTPMISTSQLLAGTPVSRTARTAKSPRKHAEIRASTRSGRSIPSEATALPLLPTLAPVNESPGTMAVCRDV